MGFFASAPWASGFLMIVNSSTFTFNSMICTGITHKSIPDPNNRANASAYNLLPLHLISLTHELGSDVRKF